LPYQEHPSFRRPVDENAKVWRFMDFAKFVQLVDSKALFFCRADRLGDDFEGYYAKGNRKWNPILYRNKLTPESIENLTKGLEEYLLTQRLYVFLNCWHLSDYESHGLWQLYSGSRGLALQSTFGRLRDSFNNNPENIFIGKVNYIDWDEDWIPMAFILDPFLHKRRNFESEKELRAVTYYDPKPEHYTEFGKHVEVDLEVLIEAIYTQPKSPDWFIRLIETVLRKYNLMKTVRTSRLSEKPSV
jgi:hypothetical protein